jgi:PST family polysaccharide transporter
MSHVSDDHQPLFANFSALTLGHALGLIAPLVTVPYLARVLRPAEWASVLVAQALAAWMVLLLDYGFELSGTRAVAQARGTRAEIGRVVWGVQGAKLLLLPIVAGVLLLACALLPAMRADRALAYSTCVFAVTRGLNPFWYFQGLERVRSAVVIDNGSKVLAALGVFVVVRDPSDGWRVMALQAAFATLACAVLTLRLWQTVPRDRTRPSTAFATLRASWPLFAFRASSTLYMQANTILLSVLASAPIVAAYGSAEKIVRAGISFLEPLTRVFLPRISFLAASDPRQAARMVRQCLAGIGAAGAVLGATVAVGAPVLVQLLLGPGYEDAVPILRVLALLPPLIAVGTVLGAYWALPCGRERSLLAATLTAGLLNFTAAFVLVPRAGGVGMAFSVVLAELFVTSVLSLLYVRWKPMIPASLVSIT